MALYFEKVVISKQFAIYQISRKISLSNSLSTYQVDLKNFDVVDRSFESSGMQSILRKLTLQVVKYSSIVII